MRFELEDLTPGKFIPAFSFVSTEGDTINEESIKGAPTLLELPYGKWIISATIRGIKD